MTKAQIKELILQNRKPRFRRQSGTIVTHRWILHQVLQRRRWGSRVKVTERLCDVGTTPAKVNLLRDSHMSAVNNARHTALQSATPVPVLTVGAFWQSTYFPWVQANKRFSTARGYETVWKIYVKPELETTPIDTYTTVDACELLDRMATVNKLNENTLSHVKSLCRGIFSTAVRKGIITVNPWREAKESVRVRKAKPRIAYTPEEIVAILNAIQRTDAKLFFTLVAVIGDATERGRSRQVGTHQLENQQVPRLRGRAIRQAWRNQDRALHR